MTDRPDPLPLTPEARADMEVITEASNRRRAEAVAALFRPDEAATQETPRGVKHAPDTCPDCHRIVYGATPETREPVAEERTDAEPQMTKMRWTYGTGNRNTRDEFRWRRCPRCGWTENVLPGQQFSRGCYNPSCRWPR